MNSIVTVKQLYKACSDILMQHGDKKIFVAVDDEGNSYRPLFFYFLTDTEEVRECDESSQSEIPEYGLEYEDVVILG